MNIFIAGDSTAAIKDPLKRPEAGWGEYIGEFFDNTITIINEAKNGRSTKSFIEEGLLQKIDNRIQKKDYLFIQFGHNDQKLEDPQRGTHPFSDYQDNLKQYIQVARSHGAIPILLTSVTRRHYLENGAFDEETLGEYPAAMKQVAQETSVALLDIYEATKALYRHRSQEETASWHLHLKPGEAAHYPNGIEDNTHYNEKGAALIAMLIATTIANSSLDLKKHLKPQVPAQKF